MKKAIAPFTANALLATPAEVFYEVAEKIRYMKDKHEQDDLFLGNIGNALALIDNTMQCSHIVRAFMRALFLHIKEEHCRISDVLAELEILETQRTQDLSHTAQRAA